MQRDHGVSLRNALSLIDQMAQNSVRVLEESMAESIWVGPLSQSNPAEVAQYSYEVCETVKSEGQIHDHKEQPPSKQPEYQSVDQPPEEPESGAGGTIRLHAGTFVCADHFRSPSSSSR